MLPLQGRQCALFRSPLLPGGCPGRLDLPLGCLQFAELGGLCPEIFVDLAELGLELYLLAEFPDGDTGAVLTCADEAPRIDKHIPCEEKTFFPLRYPLKGLGWIGYPVEP